MITRIKETISEATCGDAESCLTLPVKLFSTVNWEGKSQ